METRFTQVGIRLVKEREFIMEEELTTPDQIAQMLGAVFQDYDREVAGVVNFQIDMKPINMNIASVGNLNCTEVNVREIMKSTILSNANGIVFFHTHPSGKVSPSIQDIAVTERIMTACRIMNIAFHDHIIVGAGGRYYSFMKEEVLPTIKECRIEELVSQKTMIKDKIRKAQEMVDKKCQMGKEKEKWTSR